MIEKELGKKIWTTLLPAGKNSLSIKRYEQGVILRKAKQEIIIEYQEVSDINWALLKFSNEYKKEIDKLAGEKLTK